MRSCKTTELKLNFQKKYVMDAHLVITSMEVWEVAKGKKHKARKRNFCGRSKRKIFDAYNRKEQENLLKNRKQYAQEIRNPATQKSTSAAYQIDAKGGT